MEVVRAIRSCMPCVDNHDFNFLFSICHWLCSRLVFHTWETLTSLLLKTLNHYFHIFSSRALKIANSFFPRSNLIIIMLFTNPNEIYTRHFFSFFSIARKKEVERKRRTFFHVLPVNKFLFSSGAGKLMFHGHFIAAASFTLHKKLFLLHNLQNNSWERFKS